MQMPKETKHLLDPPDPTCYLKLIISSNILKIHFTRTSPQTSALKRNKSPETPVCTTPRLWSVAARTRGPGGTLIRRPTAPGSSFATCVSLRVRRLDEQSEGVESSRVESS